MSKLPFVVQPRLKPVVEVLGNEYSGTIEIERRGYLTAGEKTFLAAQFSSEGVTRMTLAIVRDIARKYGISQEKAYEELQGAIAVGSGKYSDKILEDFREQIEELSGAMVEVEQRRRLVTAYCLVIYRIDPNTQFEDFMELHPDLIDALAALYEDEDRRSTERLVAAIEDADTGEDNTAQDLEKK